MERGLIRIGDMDYEQGRHQMNGYGKGTREPTR